MCGRAAYSARSITAAALSLGAIQEKTSGAVFDANQNEGSGVKGPSYNKSDALSSNATPTAGVGLDGINDNVNMGPGAAAHVIRRIPRKPQEQSHAPTNAPQLECTPMIWGLLPRNGITSSPHYHPNHPKFSASPHYNIFNARSETVYEKPSFSGLMRRGQTCVFSVEGYYEWTKNTPTAALHDDDKAVISMGGDKRKQPYLTHRKDGKPLLLAGLWSCVKTGRHLKVPDSQNMEEETITTFAILTTDAHPKFSWIHHRQPVILWDDDMALEWLMRPCPTLLEKIRRVPTAVPTPGTAASPNTTSTAPNDLKTSPWENLLSVYPVTKNMNDGKYRGNDCMMEVKLDEMKVASVKSFFGSCKGTNRGSGSGIKRVKTENAENRSGSSYSPIGKSSSPYRSMNDTSSLTRKPSSTSTNAVRNAKRKKCGTDIMSFFKAVKK